MSIKYRIHTIGRTHFIQSRPAWWPFWFNRDLQDFYPKALTSLDLVKALDKGVRVVPDETSEETIHAAVELATATICGELTKSQEKVTKLEAEVAELEDHLTFSEDIRKQLYPNSKWLK